MPFVKRHRDYYKYGTEPNASIVGSPTISNGVVSGFSKSNYCKTPSSPPSNILSYEWFCKFTVGSDVTNQQGILANLASNRDTPQLFISTAGTLQFLHPKSSSVWSSSLDAPLTPNTTYWTKATWDGSIVSFYYKTSESSDYMLVGTTSATTINWTANVGIGIDTTTYPFYGSIDLTQSYIKINNKDWWRGTKAVEVPSSSITDFGRTAYYKNIVTTKYWKEITTGGRELEYACYKTDFSEDYAYVKLPIGSDKTQYKTASNGKANNPSELISGSTLTSVTENEIEMYLGAGFGSIFWYRLPEGDLYIDTTVTETVEGTPEDYTYTTTETVTVEVGVDDDYDYTEFVPSTQFDYHVDSNKLYQLAAVKRSYWKYAYQDFVQPKLTANGTLGGKSFAVAVDSRYDDYSAFKAFDGDTSTSWQSNGTTAAGTYFKMYNPNPLNITKIVWSGTPKYGTITAGIVYGSNDDVDYVELATFSGGTTSGGTMDLSSNTNYYKYYKITPTTWTDKSGTYTNGWAELTITAQEQIAVEGTSTDYDYYTDNLVSYSPIVRGKRTYYKQDLKQRDTGTYTFTLNKDYTAKMLFVGNGGGGCSSQKDSQWWYASGGSGACFEGTVRLPADTYTLTIGTLGYGNNSNNVHWHSGGVESTDSYLTNSAGEELIRVGCGAKGNTAHTSTTGGAGGVLTLGTLNVISVKKSKNGNQTTGNSSAGSLSAYDGTYSGYGAGTCGTRGSGNVYGIAGIFDLVLETDINDFDWYVDVATKIY